MLQDEAAQMGLKPWEFWRMTMREFVRFKEAYLRRLQMFGGASDEPTPEKLAELNAIIGTTAGQD